MGYQRQRVHSFLEKSSLVQSFTPAPPTSGGWGATVALLRRR
jgi:dsDNA-specific endonuclease/ATPase MutS2